VERAPNTKKTGDSASSGERRQMLQGTGFGVPLKAKKKGPVGGLRAAEARWPPGWTNARNVSITQRGARHHQHKREEGWGEDKQGSKKNKHYLQTVPKGVPGGKLLFPITKGEHRKSRAPKEKSEQPRKAGKEEKSEVAVPERLS